MLGGHTPVGKSVDDGDVEACWECCTQLVGRTKAKRLNRKHLDIKLSERRESSRNKRRGKRAERKATCTKHQAARAWSRLDELTFGTFNVRKATINGVDGIGHIDTLLRPCNPKGCDVVRLQETKSDGTSKIVASWYRVYICRRQQARSSEHFLLHPQNWRVLYVPKRQPQQRARRFARGKHA